MKYPAQIFDPCASPGYVCGAGGVKRVIIIIKKTQTTKLASYRGIQAGNP